MKYFTFQWVEEKVLGKTKQRKTNGELRGLKREKEYEITEKFYFCLFSLESSPTLPEVVSKQDHKGVLRGVSC